MADTKLSALTELAVEPADTDEVYINDGGTSKRITYGTLKTALLARANHTGTQTASTISDFDTEVSNNADVAANTAKVSNATHSGDAVGDTSLTLQPAAITGKGAVTVAGSDLLLVADVSVSPQVLGQVTAQSVANLFDASGYLPLSGGQLTGDITFAAASPEHTVDGRNVSADGAKLDGIEAGADVTDATNVAAAGAFMADGSVAVGGDVEFGGFNLTDLGDVTFKTGAAGGTLRTGTSAADKFQLQAYDVDGAAYVTLIEADAGNTVRLQLPVNYLDLEDATDTTKIARLSSASITTGTTRTYTFPDATGTFALADNIEGTAILSTGPVTDGYVLTADGAGGAAWEAAAGGGTPAGSSGDLQYNNAGSFGGSILKQGTNTLEQYNSTNAQTFYLFNTRTDASNYERGFLRWNSNVFEIGTGSAGTGSGRSMSFDATTEILFKIGGSQYARLKSGGLFPHGNNSYKLGDTTTMFSVVYSASFVAQNSYTVATLPGSPVVGQIARVTDASAPAVGSTVSGGGAAAALVWYNGSNWTVIGV